MPPSEPHLTRVLSALENLPASLERAVTHAVGKALDDNAESIGLRVRQETRIAALEGDVAELKAAQAEADSAEQVQLREELKRSRDSQAHWVRYVVASVVTLFVGGFLLWLGKVFGK